MPCPWFIYNTALASASAFDVCTWGSPLQIHTLFHADSYENSPDVANSRYRGDTDDDGGVDIDEPP